MKFFVNTQELNSAISTVIKALPTRSPVSILEGIYIEAEDDGLLLRCTDLNMQIDAIVPATIEEVGASVIPGRFFSELIRKMKADITSVDIKKTTATIENGRNKTTIQCSNAADFHAMSSVNRDFVMKISPNDIKDMTRGCIFATAQDDSKPILTGALLETTGSSATIVALDGYRLALRRKRVVCSDDAPRSIVIPGRSLLEISRALPESDEPVEMVFSRTHVTIDVGHTRITARLMEGEFIKYKQILPDNHTTRVRINRTELLDCIEVVALMARENKSNLLKFTIGTEKIEIAANSEKGRSNEDVAAEVMGNDIEIAFNAKYFSDVLKVIDDNEVYLDLNSNISPCVVRPIQNDGYYYLILPVRIFSGM